MLIYYHLVINYYNHYTPVNVNILSQDDNKCKPVNINQLSLY